MTDQFDISWFRENTTGAVEDLGPGSPVAISPAGGNFLESRYHGTAFVNQKYNPSFLGKYWCQVIINTTADPEQPLMRSIVFTLLAPENYTGSMCSDQSLIIQSVTNTTCADQPAQSDKTTLPVPTTTNDASASQTTTSQGIGIPVVSIAFRLSMVLL